MYYLEIISLEGCPYSEAAEKLVENNKINNKVFKISYNNRENHKNEKISTFPQIYLKKNNSNGRILIGGYDKINEIHSLIKNRKLIKSEEKSVYNSSYDLLVEPDDVNPIMDTVDVCVVIGANDVVNPDARENEGSPIYGMPVIEVDRAKTVFILKRSMASGFAGIDNPLFLKENSRMLFGDAKESISTLVSEFKS